MADSAHGIQANEIAMLELGIRLQQLLMLHPYAIRWREPHYKADDFGRLIEVMRSRIHDSKAFLTQSAVSLDEACYDLITFWRDAVENEFDGTWVSPATTNIPPQIEKIAGLIETAIPPAQRLAAWYRIGRIAADGRTDPATGNWILASEDAFQQHLAALFIPQTDLFVESVPTLNDHSYPEEFRGWTALEAGLVSLATVAVENVANAAHVLDASLGTHAARMDAQESPMADDTASLIPRAKRSTESGEARTKLIAALTAHHGYKNDICNDFQPIGVGELSRKANVAKSTASEFFAEQFRGHSNYKVACRDTTKLMHSLRILNGELTPSILFNPLPGDPSDPSDPSDSEPMD